MLHKNTGVLDAKRRLIFAPKFWQNIKIKMSLNKKTFGKVVSRNPEKLDLPAGLVAFLPSRTIPDDPMSWMMTKETTMKMITDFM